MLVALHAVWCDLRCYLSFDDVRHGEECVVMGVYFGPIVDVHVRVIGE